MSLPVIIIGGGGHASVLIDSLLMQSYTIIGYTEADTQKRNDRILGVSCLGGDDQILQYDPNGVLLVNGMGSVRSTERRKLIFESFKNKGYAFGSVKHPSAIIAASVYLEEGIQVMAGAIIQTGSRIGANSIVNTKVSVDHDCRIGNHVHLAPGVTLSGGVQVEEDVHLGTGAIVIQNVHIRRNSIVGAGSVVIRDVQANCTVYGVPAKGVKE